jgi:hypothetical protein
MRHFADNNYDIEKAIARYESLPFLPKVSDLGVGRADLDLSTPKGEHFRPFRLHPKQNEMMPAPAPAGGGPECPLCGSFNTALFDEFNLHCFDCNRQSSLNVSDNSRLGKNKCECWEGYKRVPGTKPCALGSCEKCDTHSKKSSDLNSQPFANPVPLADAPGTTPGNKPIDEVLENAPSAVGHGPDKTASQGDKPSPHAAQAVFEALAGGNESEAKELLKQTDCPNGCEVHPEGKCNHGFMSAGRTRVRYLINDSSFDTSDKKEFATTEKEAGFFNDVMQVAPDVMHAIPHVWDQINPAGNGVVGQGIGTIGDAIDSGVEALRNIFPNTDNPQFSLDVQELQYWHNTHSGPEYAAEWAKKVNGFVNFWQTQGVNNPGEYISR